jgi:peptide/nickel transport system substrate-binding protein
VTATGSGDLSTWDPCVIPPGASVSEEMAAVYGNLFFTDTSGVVEPGMAQSLTTTDAITWTLKLRPNVKFTDGTAYDATAVKYNWDRAADPANECTEQAWVASWKSLTITDPLTLTIVLPSADSSFPVKIAELMPFIDSPASLEAAATKTDIKPIGAGPFIMTSWDPGVSTKYDRNPGYWDQPRPYIDHFVLNQIPDTNSRIATVVQGGADYMYGYFYQYGSNASAPGVSTHRVTVPGLNILWFNTKGGVSGLMNNVLAREAVVEAIDPNKLVQALTQDSTVTAPDSLYPAPSPYHDPSLVYPTYDPAKAQQLINQVIASGTKFTLTVTHPNNSDTNRAAAYIEQVLNTYKGVTALDSSVPLSNWLQVCRDQGKFDICVNPGIQVFNGPEPNTYNYLFSTGGNNIAHLDDPNLDAAETAALAAISDTDKVAAYKKVQQIYLQDLPFWAYGVQTRVMLIQDTLGGIVNYSQASTRADLLYRCPSKCSGY